MPDRIRFLMVDIAGRLTPWQGAVSRLAEALLFDLDFRTLDPLDRDQFGEFMFQRTTPGFSIRDGLIVWKIVIGLTIWKLLVFGVSSPMRSVLSPSD